MIISNNSMFVFLSIKQSEGHSLMPPCTKDVGLVRDIPLQSHSVKCYFQGWSFESVGTLLFEIARLKSMID